jgi:hypothetical protein
MLAFPILDLFGSQPTLFCHQHAITETFSPKDKRYLCASDTIESVDYCNK